MHKAIAQWEAGGIIEEVVRNTWKAVLAKEERGFANERLFQWKDLHPSLAEEAVEILQEEGNYSRATTPELHELLERYHNNLMKRNVGPGHRLLMGKSLSKPIRVGASEILKPREGGEMSGITTDRSQKSGLAPSQSTFQVESDREASEASKEDGGEQDSEGGTEQDGEPASGSEGEDQGMESEQEGEDADNADEEDGEDAGKDTEGDGEEGEEEDGEEQDDEGASEDAAEQHDEGADGEEDDVQMTQDVNAAGKGASAGVAKEVAVATPAQPSPRVPEVDPTPRKAAQGTSGHNLRSSTKADGKAGKRKVKDVSPAAESTGLELALVTPKEKKRRVGRSLLPTGPAAIQVPTKRRIGRIEVEARADELLRAEDAEIATLLQAQTEAAQRKDQVVAKVDKIKADCEAAEKDQGQVLAKMFEIMEQQKEAMNRSDGLRKEQLALLKEMQDAEVAKRESSDRLAQKKKEARQKMADEAAKLADEAAMLTTMAEARYG